VTAMLLPSPRLGASPRFIPAWDSADHDHVLVHVVERRERGQGLARLRGQAVRSPACSSRRTLTPPRKWTARGQKYAPNRRLNCCCPSRMLRPPPLGDAHRERGQRPALDPVTPSRS
jgi:hypothetical protein